MKQAVSRVSLGGLQWTCLGLMIMVVVITSWGLGGVHDTTYAIAGVLAIIGLFLVAIDTWHVSTPQMLGNMTLRWLFLTPMLLGVIQLTPLPRHWTKILTPQPNQLRERLAVDNDRDWLATSALERVNPSSSHLQTISLVPSATRNAIAKYWVVASFLFVSLLTLSNSKRRQAFLWFVVLNGTLIAIFAFVQKLSWNGKLFWSISVPWPFVLGPFVNKNNGAGYLLLALAAAMSLFTMQLLRKDDTDSLKMLSVLESLRFHWVQSLHDTRTFTICLSIALLWLAILISLSRGGFAGGVAATATTAILVWRRNWWSILAITIATAAIAWGLIMWTNQDQGIAARISSISESSEYEETRFLHWADDVRMSGDFLPLGCGLGTYEHANRPYQSFLLARWFRYSENQFLESAITGGIPGLFILLSFLYVSWRASRQLLISGNSQHHVVATLGIFIIISQMVAGFFDFGLYNAANSILMACLIGIVIGFPGIPHKTGTPSLTRHREWLVMMLVLGCFSVYELCNRANVERAMAWSAKKIEVADTGPHTGGRSLDKRMSQLARALKWYPDHPYGHAKLANMQTAQFRHVAFDDLRSSVGNSISEDKLWSLTRPFIIGQQIRKADSPSDALASITSTRAYNDYLIPAWQSYLRSREISPWIPRVHYRLALLEPLVRDDPSRAIEHLERSLVVAPQAGDLLFNAGILAARYNERRKSFEWIRRAVHAEKRLPSHVADFARTDLTPDELVNLILPPKPLFLLDVATRHFSDNNDTAWQTALGRKSRELLISVDETKGADRLYLLGQSQLLEQDFDGASKHLRAALDEEPSIAPWRLAYARALARNGQSSSALREAKLVLRLVPDSWRAKKLIREMELQLRRKSRS